jgi:hypothetical protein
VVVEDVPRIRINIAPGVYKAQTEFLFLKSFGINVPPAGIGFNLMFNYIDYHLEEGAIMVNYIFRDSRFINSYDDDTQIPTKTNVFGNGIFYSNENAGFNVTGQPNLQIILREGSSMYFEAYKTNLGGYVKSAELIYKADTVIFDNKKVPQPPFQDSAQSLMFYIDTDYYELPEDILPTTYCYFECRELISIRKYNGGTNGWERDIYSGIFQIFGGNVDVKIGRMIGRDYTLANEDSYSEYKINSVTTQWIENYFNGVDNIEVGSCGLINYAENYHPHRFKYNFEIGYARVNGVMAYLGSVYDANAYLNINIKIDYLELESWAKNPFFEKQYYFFGMDYDDGFNCFLTTEIGKCVTREPFNEDAVVFFYDNSFSNVGYNYKHYIKNSNYRLESDTQVFLFNTENNKNVEPSIIFDNVKTELIGTTANFCLVNDLGLANLNIRVYQNCFSNVAVNTGVTTITNLITGTDIVVDADVKIY